MAELVRLKIEKLPAICVVGKQMKIKMSDLQTANPIPGFWDRCHSDGTFTILESHEDFIYDPSYVGCIVNCDMTAGTMEYLCGMLMKCECPVLSEEFIVKQIDECEVAVGWVQGDSADVFANGYTLTAEGLKREGYIADYLSGWWLESYNCPRFTNPDEKGNIILDYYLPCKRMNEAAFLWFDWSELNGDMSNDEIYAKIVAWAARARVQNPAVFDALSEWVLNDLNWSDDKLDKNEQMLIQGILLRLKEQNLKLRTLLRELKPAELVNKAVFNMLDNYDTVLSGVLQDDQLQEIVSKIYTDFSIMYDRGVREKIAGYREESVKKACRGYIDHLKDCDIALQWTIFMPDLVNSQLNGFKIENFEYREFSALRFIGMEGENFADVNQRMEKMSILDAMQEYKSGFDYDILFMHHYGLTVEHSWHGVWGRFMKAETPVPEGFQSFDFTSQDNSVAGPPYYSRFAFATFSGDMEAMHTREGFDCDAMYDVTRNIILSEGVNIPYPDKYWTAEVFIDGWEKESTGYLFSVELR